MQDTEGGLSALHRAEGEGYVRRPEDSRVGEFSGVLIQQLLYQFHKEDLRTGKKKKKDEEEEVYLSWLPLTGSTRV